MTYETAKKGTKKHADIIARARRNEGSRLSDVYGNFSAYKERAEREIMEECYLNQNGSFYHICSHNSQTFTCAFETETHVFYFTAYHSYKVEK